MVARQQRRTSRVPPLLRVDAASQQRFIEMATQIYKARMAEEAARPALPTDEDDLPAEAPGSFLQFIERFYQGYHAGAVHRLMAKEIEAALTQRDRALAQCAALEEALASDADNTALAAELEAAQVAATNPYWLMLFVPPQHGKSEQVSVQAPAWYLANHPGHYWVNASYASDLAEKHSGYAREITRSPHYTGLYDLHPSLVSDAKKEWAFSGHRGGMTAVGVGSGLTGRQAHVLVIDDPVKDRVAANSETQRESTWGWWTAVARTRLQPGAIVILVMTRWHYDDLGGRLIAEDAKREHKRWRVVRIPARANRPDDPLGRPLGAPLWTERFPNMQSAEQFYTALEEDLGPMDWAALAQGEPTLGEHALFQPQYWGYYDPHTDLPPAHSSNRGFLYIVQMWDTAFKEKTTNDFNACVTLGVTGRGIYVLEVYNQRHELPGLLAAATVQAGKWGPTHLRVENKASGPSMAQMLRVATKRIYVDLWEPEQQSDKVSRAAAVMPMVARGEVLLPHCTCGLDQAASPPWLNEFLIQLYQFPAATFDDMVDAFTGALQVVKDLTDGANVMHVANGYAGGDASGYIAPGYVDRDTGRAPSPELVRRPYT